MANLPRYLIVNADDYGIAEGVSRGILQAHHEGILTSTTFMVNFPWAEEMAALLPEAPRLGVGIHLNLTTGGPVLPPSEVPSLVRPDGRFTKSLGHLLFGVKREEVYREWCAQVEKGMRLLGRTPTHLDSHRYLQAYPGFVDVFLRVAKRYGVPAVRCLYPGPGVDPSALFPRWLPAGRLAQHYLARAAAATAASGLKRPAATLLGDNDREVVLAKLRQAGEGVTELICHPGRVDARLRTLTSLLEQREVELAALTDPAVRQAVARGGIELVSFADLGG